MFRFFLTFFIFQYLLTNVLSLNCYVCSNCNENSNYKLTSQFIELTNNLSCYKIISKLYDNSKIIIRGYTNIKCSSLQIIHIWGYQQGYCCSTDYCNKHYKLNQSFLFILFILFFLII